MPIKITKSKLDQPKHIKMPDMLKHTDCIFQQYSKGIPQEVYYINCGRCEKHLIVIWHDDEGNTYRLSTDNIQSLKEFNDHVTAVDVTEIIDIQIDIKMLQTIA